MFVLPPIKIVDLLLSAGFTPPEITSSLNNLSLSSSAKKCPEADDALKEYSVPSNCGDSPPPKVALAPPPKVNQAILVPGHPDFFVSYSTLPGSAAYGDSGSLYVRALGKRLLEKNSLELLLKLVTEDVKMDIIWHSGSPNQQLPFYVTTGNKLIFLNK